MKLGGQKFGERRKKITSALGFLWKAEVKNNPNQLGFLANRSTNISYWHKLVTFPHPRSLSTTHYELGNPKRETDIGLGWKCFSNRGL